MDLYVETWVVLKVKRRKIDVRLPQSDSSRQERDRFSMWSDHTMKTSYFKEVENALKRNSRKLL